jgi:hypothetical protein
VPNPSCDFAGSETLYEFVGQVEPGSPLALSARSGVLAAGYAVAYYELIGMLRYSEHRLF